jgi:catechol 2,3-dioxygenase-like lactoylglutathione lyase family enzyme
MTSVRYIVDDVDAAVGFYTDLLGFSVDMRPGPGFAAVSRGGRRRLLH